MKNGDRIFVSGLFIFLCGFFCLTLFAADDFIDPYSFYHSRYTKTIPQAIDEFGALPFPLNTEIRPVVSGRPSIIMDSDGNKKIYLNGKLLLSIEKNGDMTFFGNSQKYCKVTAKRALIRTYGWDSSGICTVKNEWGEVVGYEQYRFGGRISSRFDSRMNLTNMYFYDEKSTGYWDFNVITRQWSRYDLGKAVETRVGSQGGEACSYWRQEEGCLWEIKMTAIIVKDENGLPVLGEDGSVLTKIAEGERIKYNGNDQSQPLEVYDFEGKLKVSYVWDNYRLKKVIDYENGTYQKYGELSNQIIEEGIFNSRGEEIITWEHVWKGSRHVASYEQVIDPLGSGFVRSGKYMTYTAEDNVDEVRLAVNDTNIAWVSALYSVAGMDVPKIGGDILLADYVYFYEVSELSVQELADSFRVDSAAGQSLYDIIQEDKGNEKANAGLFCRVVYGMGSNRILLYNEFNQQDLSLNMDDNDFPGIEAGLLSWQAGRYLECGDYAGALELCNEFDASYGKEAESRGARCPLGELYLRVRDIKAQALAKLGA